MPNSWMAYALLVGIVAVQRLLEVSVSRRNVRRAMARGAVEAGAGDYPWMVALHAAFLCACLVETVALRRPWIPALGIPMLALLAAATVLRYWVILTLGSRWTTRVVYVPGDPLVRTGPFRWLRHPNYIVVTLEMAALPLVHTAWITAALFSAANAVLLRRRITAEEGLLGRLARDPEGNQA